MIILVLNAIVGVWQETNAENALEALKQMQSEHAATWRNGKLVHNLPASELVPGDIVDVHVGDKIPADMRVIKLLTTTVLQPLPNPIASHSYLCSCATVPG